MNCLAVAQKFIPQMRHRGESGAMAGDQPFDIQSTQLGYRGLHPLRAGMEEMHTSEHRVNGTVGRECADKVQGVNNSRMSTPENDNRARLHFQEGGLVVLNLIRFAAAIIPEKSTAGIFIVVCTGDGTRAPNPVSNFRRCLNPMKTGLGPNSLLYRFRHSDVTGSTILITRKFRREGRWMGENPSTLSLLQGIRQSTRVIIVAVTENDSVDRIQPDSKALSILSQNQALPRVKENFTPGHLDPERKPMLGQQSVPLAGVFCQDRGFEISHALRPRFPGKQRLV